MKTLEQRVSQFNSNIDVLHALQAAGLYIDFDGTIVSTRRSLDEWREMFNETLKRVPFTNAQFIWQANDDVIYDDLSVADLIKLQEEFDLLNKPVLPCAHIGCNERARHAYDYVPLCKAHIEFFDTDCEFC